jgi:hypothetical protein
VPIDILEEQVPAAERTASVTMSIDTSWQESMNGCQP